MRLGIFAKTFDRPGLEQTLDAVQNSGFGVIQFNLSSAGLPTLPDKADLEKAERIRLACARRNITIAAVSGTFNMVHPDPAQLRRDIGRFRNLAAMCPAMGASVITLCTGSRNPDDMWRSHPDNGSTESWRTLVKTMRELLEIAEQYDVKLAFEPEPANVASDAAKGRALLDALNSRRLFVVMDAANLFDPLNREPHGRTIEHAMKLLGERVIIAHAKDYTVKDRVRFCAAGKGDLDYGAYIRHLRAAGYGGPLILHGLREEEVPECSAFLRGKLAGK